MKTRTKDSFTLDR